MRTSTDEGRNSALLDKSPVYRTHEIFNGVFKKKVNLRVAEENGPSKTNCRGIIWLNFHQPIIRQIEEEAYHEDGRNYYNMSCGHIFKSGKNVTHQKGKHVPCFRCGGNRVYRTLEHEWSHIIFKSNPHLYLTFINEYINTLSQEGYQSTGLVEFFHMLINGFDDIRVNSLLQYVYEGAAYDIWEKWKDICEESDDMVNDNLIALLFGVALNATTVDHHNGEYSELIPIIKEATSKVKGKGPGNMLVVVRWFMDRCIRKMLSKTPDQQQQQPQQGQGQQQAQQQTDPNQQPQQGSGQQQDAGSQGQDQQSDPQSQQSQPPWGQPNQSGQQDQGQDQGQAQQQGQGGEQGDKGGQQSPSNVSPGNDAGDSDDKGRQKDSLQHGPPVGQSMADTKAKNVAMQTLRKGSKPLTAEEDYHVPNRSTEPDPNKNVTAAAASAALAADVSDDDAVDDKIQAGQMDSDVKTAVDLLKNTVRTQSSNDHLLSNAKAKILLIDVKPGDIRPEAKVELNQTQRITVNRMRSSFTQVMGRKQAKMDTDGLLIDVESVIQYMVDPSQNELFEEEETNKGFAYLILCDMSGSMHGDPFNQVCNGAEMLKTALDYPFVQGDMWGFRGAMHSASRRSVASRKQWVQQVTSGGQVWIYRYDRNCKGYLGSVDHPKAGRLKVDCNGLTPMNSAIHVALKYLMTHVPVGMAKRLFLLTDGNPTHTATSGKSLSTKFLRTMVAKEIREGRQKGVETFSFVIGSQQGITDKEALEMFGPRKFWDRVDGNNSIDDALIKVVRTNFVKYLKGA